MTYHGPVADQAAYLTSLLPGLSPLTAQAWLLNEGQSDSIATPSNPLNIIVAGGGSGTGLEIGSNGPLYTYGDWHAGLQAVVGLLHANQAYGGILAAIRSGDPIAQARAIETSPWAGGHYGGANAPGNVTAATRRLLGMTGPVPSGAATMQSAPSIPVTPVVHVSTTPWTSTDLAAGINRLMAVAPAARSVSQRAALTTDYASLVRDLGGSESAANGVLAGGTGRVPVSPAPSVTAGSLPPIVLVSAPAPTVLTAAQASFVPAGLPTSAAAVGAASFAPGLSIPLVIIAVLLVIALASIL